MHIKKKCDCELPQQSCRLGRASVDFFDSGPALVLFRAPAQRKCEGGGICDARVEVHPVNWLTPEDQDPETQPHFVHPRGRDSCTAFHWESPTKDSICVRHLVNNYRAGVRFSPIVVTQNKDASRFLKLTHPRSKRR